MRKQFVNSEDIHNTTGVAAGDQTKVEALHYCPWACVVLEVEGGFMCFESQQDATIWENQA